MDHSFKLLQVQIAKGRKRSAANAGASTSTTSHCRGNHTVTRKGSSSCLVAIETTSCLRGFFSIMTHPNSPQTYCTDRLVLMVRSVTRCTAQRPQQNGITYPKPHIVSIWTGCASGPSSRAPLIAPWCALKLPSLAIAIPRATLTFSTLASTTTLKCSTCPNQTWSIVVSAVRLLANCCIRASCHRRILACGNP